MTPTQKNPLSSRTESEEDTLEFTGLPDDAPRAIPASESEIGGIAHDERGHARWKWKTDVAASADPSAENFNFLNALDTELEIERSQKLRALEESMKTGLNPYDTARLRKPK